MSQVSKFKQGCRTVDAVVGITALLVFDSLFAFLAGVLIGTVANEGVIKGAVPGIFGGGVLLFCVLFAQYVIAACLNRIEPEQSGHSSRTRVVSWTCACVICVSAAVIGGIVPSTQNALFLVMGIAVAAFIALVVSRLTLGVIGGLGNHE